MNRWANAYFLRCCFRSYTAPLSVEEGTLMESVKKGWNEAFVQAMKNRYIVGACRYGPVLNDPIGFIERLKDKLDLYEKTGNLDLLPDIANYAMLEATAPRHRNAHWPESLESTDEENARKVGIGGLGNWRK